MFRWTDSPIWWSASIPPTRTDGAFARSADEARSNRPSLREPNRLSGVLRFVGAASVTVSRFADRPAAGSPAGIITVSVVGADAPVTADRSSFGRGAIAAANADAASPGFS